MSILFSDPELMRTLQQRGKSVYCHKARTLFRQGDLGTGIYILNRGEVTLWTDIPGRGFIGLIEKTPKALLGLPDIIDAKPHVHSAIAHSGAELNFLTLKEFRSLLRSDASLLFEVLRLLALDVEVARREVLQPLCGCAERASLLPSKEECDIVPIALIDSASLAGVHRRARI
jgi:CRP-like cAMP-binding protein